METPARAALPAARPSPVAKPPISLVILVPGGPVEYGPLVEEFGREVASAGHPVEFVFMLDGSPTSVFEELVRFKGSREDVKILHFREPFGEAAAVLAALDAAKGELLVTLPPYLQVEPTAIHDVLDAFREGFDLICGWRHPRVDPWTNRLQSALFNAYVRWTSRVPFHDLNCTFRGIRRRVLQDIPLYGDFFRYLPVLALRRGFQVKEIRVRHLKEQGPAGYFGFGVYGRRALDIVNLLFLTKFVTRPLRFFGLFGAFLMIVGAAICIDPVIGKLFKGEGLSDRPLLVAGVALGVVGFQTVCVGLLAEVFIYTQHKTRGFKDHDVDSFYR
jgi:glycosyltransferase involved in cell wall biosynthesis